MIKAVSFSEVLYMIQVMYIIKKKYSRERQY